MKKIVALNGSPHRSGCSSLLIEEIGKGVEEQGAEITSYFLREMDIRPCRGCYSCREQGWCVQPDDMHELYDEIAQADGIVFGTPVYMWQMTGQLKLVVDRLMPFLKDNYESALAPGKKIVLSVSQGNKNTSAFRPYFEHVAKSLQSLGFGEYKILIASGAQDPEVLREQTEVLAEARRLGAWLAE